MKLEKQVCSLESAKRLKELGVKQNSLWCYYKSKKWDMGYVITLKENTDRNLHNIYSLVLLYL